MPGGGAYPPVGNGGGSFGSTASRNARQSPPRSSLDDRSIAHTRASHRARARARTHHPPVTRQTTSSASSVSVPTVPGTCSDRARREIHPDVLDRRRRNPGDRDGRLGTEAASASRGDRADRRGNRVGRRGSRAGPGLGRTCRREGEGEARCEGWSAASASAENSRRAVRGERMSTRRGKVWGGCD